LDLDHFKQINDVHGHVVGDEVLREAGRAVYDSLRQDDLVARLGGDEFGLLLWVPDESAAGVVVDRVRTVLPSRLSQTAPYRVTASAGYCIAPRRSAPPLPSADALYAAADAALHEAKRRGRNRTVGGKG
jgi:diguanylate cyclase (GGDEF)-like protein